MGRLIHRSAWKKGNSPKFAVASDRTKQAPGPRARHGGASSESERRDLVAFVAPSCSKALRLVTLQLPENYCPIGPGLSRTPALILSPRPRSPLTTGAAFAVSGIYGPARAH